jgi:DDE family transposase
MQTPDEIDKQVMVHLDERTRRIYAGGLAKKYGYGGVSKVHRELGIDHKTIRRGMKELGQEPLKGRIRKEGAGRKREEEKQIGIGDAIEDIIEPKGDTVSILRWTNKSLKKLKKILKDMKGIDVCEHVIADVLHQRGYSLQANKKSFNDKKQDPKKRDKQFKYIRRLSEGFIKSGNPVVSMDTKKKELIGNFKNNGKEYRPKGNPREVNDHDFGKKKAIPYGIYDIAADQGFVNVGQDHDTAQFAVASLKRWWEQTGRVQYESAKYLMITADSGGSNGYRLNQFKWELQQFANETGLKIFVSHFPPGTSKWNKIEHNLFCYISKNWAGKPLISYEVVLGFIGNTTTESGLKVRASLDTGTYHLRQKPTKEQMKQVHLRRHMCHPEWNYTIEPVRQEASA